MINGIKKEKGNTNQTDLDKTLNIFDITVPKTVYDEIGAKSDDASKKIAELVKKAKSKL